MYKRVRSKVKYENELNSELECYLRSKTELMFITFLFLDLCKHKAGEVDVHTVKLFLQLNADVITLFIETAEGLQFTK